ncbi:MAG: helix-turn-helix domain-containing protein [Armatimonadota bacterium]
MLSSKDVISAILSTNSRTEAAQSLGVSRATLYRLLRRPSVQKELDDLLESLQTATAVTQADALEVALRTLVHLAQSESVPPEVRINACKEIFKHCGFSSRIEIVDE